MLFTAEVSSLYAKQLDALAAESDKRCVCLFVYLSRCCSLQTTTLSFISLLVAASRASAKDTRFIVKYQFHSTTLF